KILQTNTAPVAPVTFIGSAIIALGLIIYAVAAPESAAAHFDVVNTWITNEAGWFYMLAVGIFVIFLLGLAMSRLGTVKLGPDDSVPDYMYGTWVAMLFSAGMGIGIVFYGVAEPIMHYSQPPNAPPHSAEAARDAMEITFFHWGVHAWAIYAVLGLAMAYFGYRRGSPQTLATQLIPIAIVTALATITVATGLDNGIRRLSEFIILVSVGLMLLILILGPTRFLLQALVENIGLYLHAFVARTFHISAYEPTDWMGKWTLFYWGWWISWSPFVGMFIARISRGRTIREFLVGVLFAPAGFSFVWFTVFGDLAIWLDANVANGDISRTVGDNLPIALFTVFDYPPWSGLLAW